MQPEGLSAFRMELDMLKEEQCSRAFISGHFKCPKPQDSGCPELRLQQGWCLLRHPLLPALEAGVMKLSVPSVMVWLSLGEPQGGQFPTQMEWVKHLVLRSFSWRI